MGILKDNIAQGISNIVSVIRSIPDMVGDVIKSLVIPSGSPLMELRELIDEKYPFIAQLSVWIQSLNYGDYSEGAPNFSIVYNGETYNLIDFSLFAQYRPLVLGISSALLVTSFIFWLIKFVPKLLKGVN